ncbi:hypothetical protein [Kocuria rhizophila]|uniref:PD-(D/E)XK nuclease domain-containing protein n=1 Tax=Kocuria rhizophila TaxID=72000 RepID=UPI001269F52D|nr:hypothetical protein [Kocuria rhizophila]
MSIHEPSTDEITALIHESETLEERMAAWQEQSADPDSSVVAEVRHSYRTWCTRARRLLGPSAQKNFDGYRDGTLFSPGVSKYLESPREPSVFRAGDGSYPLGRWQLPFSQIRHKLERQRTLLIEASLDAAPNKTSAVKLGESLRRLPALLNTLQRRAPDWPIGQNIKDESDLQIIVEAYLRTLYDDVRPEDYVPSHAGANSRVDFRLPEVGIIVETKMTREALTDRKLGEELLIDAGRYPAHPDCKAIVAFVYDPARRIHNPRGLEQDLTERVSMRIPFVCVIVN